MEHISGLMEAIMLAILRVISMMVMGYSHGRMGNSTMETGRRIFTMEMECFCIIMGILMKGSSRIIKDMAKEGTNDYLFVHLF